MKLNKLQPIAKQSAESLGADSLRSFILSGDVKPGARLTEIALANQMGIARATLRTGLHRLVSEGIVVQIPYTGWHVVKLDSQDVWELWTLRGSLESLAARLAAQRSTEPDVRAAIGLAYDNLKEACRGGDMKQIGACDFALHRAMIESARHARLERQYALVEQQIKLYIATSNSLVEDGPQAILEQHAAMVEALLSGDAEGAAQAALWHNESEGQRLGAWLREQPVG